VNISSNGARMSHAGPIVYTTAKAALTAFGKAIAEEFGTRGVRVNTVLPLTALAHPPGQPTRSRRCGPAAARPGT
jgi:NAD(P)-dependent dehydrogenase (short-subunit alcohol dehydrogenase family)